MMTLVVLAKRKLARAEARRSARRPLQETRQETMVAWTRKRWGEKAESRCVSI